MEFKLSWLKATHRTFLLCSPMHEKWSLASKGLAHSDKSVFRSVSLFKRLMVASLHIFFLIDTFNTAYYDKGTAGGNLGVMELLHAWLWWLHRSTYVLTFIESCAKGKSILSQVPFESKVLKQGKKPGGCNPLNWFCDPPRGSNRSYEHLCLWTPQSWRRAEKVIARGGESERETSLCDPALSFPQSLPASEGVTGWTQVRRLGAEVGEGGEQGYEFVRL